MDIDYGAKVIDKNGKVIGTVSRVIRDSWTGEISKFGVTKGKVKDDALISTEDVAEATADKVKLKIALDEV